MLINKINNPFAKLFYLAHTLQAQGRINPEEKGYLKDLIIKEDKGIFALLQTFNWSQNLQGLENNILDRVLKKQDELEVIISPNRSPSGKQRNNSKKPSRVVVPSNRQLSFYSLATNPAAGIFVEQMPMKSMPSIDIKEDSKFSRQEKHSPSLQVIPSYKKERIQVEKSSENSYESLEFKENIKKKEQETKIEEKKDIVVRSVIEKEFIKEKEDLIPVIMPNREKKSIQNKNSSAFQIIITETRNRSKTDQINFNPKSTFMKPNNIETYLTVPIKEKTLHKQVKTATLNPNIGNKVSNVLESEIKPIQSSKLMYRANHSVENTPASNSKEQNSVQLRFNNNDTNSRRERSLSAFTDDSFAEPCGFMDYYKAYKVENDIPPSELGDNEGLGNSNPIAFGTGIGRRNTVEVNHLGQFVHMKSKEISAISEQIEENSSPQDKRKTNRKKLQKENSLELKKNLIEIVRDN